MMQNSELDIKSIREQFPVLNQQVNNHPLVYFDNAATTQKPKRVVEALTDYYYNYNSNIHRGIHSLAEKATIAFEQTRDALRNFINAKMREEVIFTKGTTESINLVASVLLSAKKIKSGDEIIVSIAEHHSNFVPWQILCEKSGAILRVTGLNEEGQLDLEQFQKLLSKKTALVAINHASNALGNINEVNFITKLAKEHGALVLIDGAQAAPHLTIDVQEIGCDFYAFSAHKMYGPTGTGALYAKKDTMESLPPWHFGGEMIEHVSLEKTSFAELPYRYEAGTPNIAGVIAWREAIKFIEEIGQSTIREYENALTHYAIDQWSDFKEVNFYGDLENRVSVVSFDLDGIHSFDVGQMLDANGIALRTGQHCTEPLMNNYKIDGTIRASFSVYNTIDEIDKMTTVLEKLIKFFK